MSDIKTIHDLEPICGAVEWVEDGQFRYRMRRSHFLKWHIQWLCAKHWDVDHKITDFEALALREKHVREWIGKQNVSVNRSTTHDPGKWFVVRGIEGVRHRLCPLGWVAFASEPTAFDTYEAALIAAAVAVGKEDQA